MEITQEKDDVNKKLSLKVWKPVFKYALQKWPIVVLILVCLSVTSFYDSMFSPLMNAAIIQGLDNMYPGTEFLEILFPFMINGQTLFSFNYITFVITMFAGILIRAINIFVLFFSINYLEMHVLLCLRRDAFDKVQQLSFSYFDKTPVGWMISRISNDASSVSELLSWGVMRIFWISFDLMFTLITMFMTNWMLSLVVLSLCPLLFIIVTYFNRMILVRHRIARNAYSNYIRWLAECISGTQTIKTLAIEPTIEKEANEIVVDLQKKRFRAFRPNAYYSSCFNLLSAISISLIIYVGAYVFRQNDIAISMATLILFVGFVSSIYNPLSEFSDLFSEFVATQASIEKLMSLINTKPELVDSPEVIVKYGDVFHNKKENFEPLIGDIYFNHVSFSYIEGTEVIHNLDLHIKKGTSVAIVGETGSGKSTTVSLLCRFYQPTKGEIDIDGVNYLSRSVGWLRSNIGLVQQTPFIFSTSIKENIKYGNHEASDDDVVNSCKIVGVHDFIMTLKDGYNTVLEEEGSELSVGQKQLISFARAIIRDPKIMILDEATSSIDTETEQQIQNAIGKVLKNRTSLIIAHRLSTIVDSDRILVMDKGIVVEDGNHVSLMEKKGYYYNLYMDQFKDLSIDRQLETYATQIKDKGLKI